MNESSIFKNSHRLSEGLIPIKKLTAPLISRLGLPDTLCEEIEEIKGYMPEHFDHVYYAPDNLIYQFCYYNDVVYIDMLNLRKTDNEYFKTKERIDTWLEAMNTMRKEKDYTGMFSAMEKKILIPSYLTLFREIPNKQKYDIFRNLYKRSEYGFHLIDIMFLKEVFAYSHFSEDYKSSMKKLQDIIKDEKSVIVYRGATTQSTPLEKAFSWTLSYETAEYFASRFGSKGKIYQATVYPERIKDYLDSRNEEEVLILPQDIHDVALVWERG